jgi:hypothetical protein
MANRISFLFIFLLFLFIYATPVHAALTVKMDDKSCLTEERKEAFKDLKEAEEYLWCLLKERKNLEGDFYGINLTAYRYVNIFDRLGYIRYRIMQIDKEIKKTKLEIEKLRK